VARRGVALVHLMTHEQVFIYIGSADPGGLSKNVSKGSKFLVGLELFLIVVYHSKNCLYFFYVNSDFMQRFWLFSISVFLQMPDQSLELVVSKFFKTFHFCKQLI